MKEIVESPAAEDAGMPFFRRLDWSAFWAACILSFAVYFYTLAPTLTLEDSGELAVAGDYLGVPHPPGYPIWTMIAWVFTKLFAFVRFRGQPNPAWAIGLMSAVFGSLAAGVIAMLICRSGSDMLRKSGQTSHNRSTENLICWVGGVVSSLLFAFSPAMWSQSVIVEVYSLNAFFLVLIFLLTYRWMCRPTDKLLCLTAFIFGLGLTNYQVLILAALALVVVVLLKDLELFRDFLIVGAPFVIAFFLIKAGKLKGISNPTDTSCFVYMSLNFLVLILAYFFLPRGKSVALTFLFVELGVAFYAFMPIVSDLRNPPMNWAYPRTWEGFVHALTRGQYEKINPANVFSIQLIDQIGDYLTDLRGQFTLPVALLGFLPFTAWQIRFAGRRVKSLYVAIVLSLLASVIIVVEEIFVPTGLAPLIRLYKFLIGLVIIILAIGGLTVFIDQTKELILKLRRKMDATISERATIALVLLGVVVVFLFYVKILAGKLVAVTAPLRQTGATIASEQLRQIFLQSAGICLFIIAPALLVALITWLMHSRSELKMAIDNHSQKWVIATLLGFLSMSIMLIVLANPRGDIQDSFIQRVKFISSHALFAFWIGYGLIFGLAFVDTLFRGNLITKWLSLSTAMLLSLTPIQQNICNRELIRIFGGAEQNGHDFGWQFGNYQLHGAEAISEELDTQEEPLPNPEFPFEMGQDAIFFGGTDPGRFVPTYMIYSARVREDVYLITQNALADNTYMSVMRDLYGDRIWIPAQPDSAMAFQRYVNEVKAGKRPQNAELKIENGRVQVSGALGVMEINGILAEMIFEHNNYKHDFYVEESYVIAWMYPYLEPHGLIMKINRDRIELSGETIRNDMDFWDWYVRRLMSETKFIRDICARKSFSKLRSAIAGLYSSRGKIGEAENAFQEARMLYSLSPEANFRLVQEVYMRQGRFAEAREVMTEFGKQDPHNGKSSEFLNHLDGLEKLAKRITELENLMFSGKLDINNALELAGLYQQAGQMPKFMNLTANILGNAGLPPVFHFRVAKLLDKAQKFDEMTKALDLCIEKLPSNIEPEIFLDMAKMYANAKKYEKVKEVLEQYLKRKPTDWRAWLDLATLQINLKESNAAVQSLEQAIQFGGNEARGLIAQNPLFVPIRNKIDSSARNLMGIPGITGSVRHRP